MDILERKEKFITAAKLVAAYSMSICLSSAAYAIGCRSGELRETEASSSGRVRMIGEMSAGRAAHASTLLADGNVLVTGGFRTGGGSLSATELYVAAAGRFGSPGSMNFARAGHTATRLRDGRVLIAGGYDGGYLQSTEIFDPKLRTFSNGPQLTMPRSEHTATTLKDGRVLIVGGVGTGWTFLSDAEIYDPASGRFTPVGKMSVPRESHTATLLTDGRVLITGGHKDRRSAMTIFSKSEVFDPSKNVFESVGDMKVKRHKHAAAMLSDGKVVIIGGSDERDSQGAYTSIEVFDPKLGEFALAGEMRRPRYKLNAAIAVLPNGKVLIAGGSDSAEIFDPETRRSREIEGSFGSFRLFSTTTLLPGGRVLIVGGYDQRTQVSSGAWMFEQVATRE